MKNFFLAVLCVFVLAVQPGFSQKRTLDTTSYKDWKGISAPVLSYDGNWAMYNCTDELSSVKYLVNTQTAKQINLPGIKNAAFFNQGKWIRYTVAGKGAVDSVILMRLKDHKKIFWNRKLYFTESAFSPYLVYNYQVKDQHKMVIWNVEAGDSTTMEQPAKYTFYKAQNAIIYIHDQQLKAGPVKGRQVLIYDGKVTDYTFDEHTMQGLFLTGSQIFSYSLITGKHQKLIDLASIAAPEGYKILPRLYEITSKTKEIMFDLQLENNALNKEQHRIKNTKPVSPGFDLELWTWNEPVSQRRQRKGAADKMPPELPKFIYHVDTKKWMRIVPEKSGIMIVPKGEACDYVFITDPKPYVPLFDWRYNDNVDVYAVNTHTGLRTLVAKDSYYTPQWSPNGNYAIIYNSLKKEWQVFDPVKVQFASISDQIHFPVFNEDQDMPRPADAYGLAGWASQGNSVVLYDRYDMWVIDLSGTKKAYSLTNGYGRAHQVSFRLQGAAYQEDLDITKNLTLASFNEQSKSEGIYHLTAGHKIEKVADDPQYSVKVLATAQNGSSVVFTKESYTDFPDLWWGTESFSSSKRLTMANPQQQEYKWGSAKVVAWKNFDGKQNQGLLYLPEGYDPKKSYPMIVDFYETHSENLHEYIKPLYSTCTINIPTYVSKGYIVFRPDVHFTVGQPGESAYNAVISGTKALIERGVADKDRIGVQGHSWSGFEVAYLVTKTNLFKCANIGAGVVNATYNYFAIRGNGAPCLFKYEVEQSRLGKNLWEGTDLYLKNSPIFNADKIETPLLIFHNDKDGAVAFTQGLDLLLAMRRLQKPAWLLNYRGEGHTLSGRPAQRDWTLRMEQFFDHYLMAKPVPRWMAEGISVDEHNLDQKYDYSTQ